MGLLGSVQSIPNSLLKVPFINKLGKSLFPVKQGVFLHYKQFKQVLKHQQLEKTIIKKDLAKTYLEKKIVADNQSNPNYVICWLLLQRKYFRFKARGAKYLLNMYWSNKYNVWNLITCSLTFSKALLLKSEQISAFNCGLLRRMKKLPFCYRLSKFWVLYSTGWMLKWTWKACEKMS